MFFFRFPFFVEDPFHFLIECQEIRLRVGKAVVSRLEYLFRHRVRFDFCVGSSLKIGVFWLEGDADVMQNHRAFEVLTNITET